MALIKVTEVVKEELLLFIQQRIVGLRRQLHSMEINNGTAVQTKSLQDQITEYKRLKTSLEGAGPGAN